MSETTPIDQYSLSSDEICGEYPFKKIDYKNSHKIDILKQATNRIVSGKSTYQEEYAIIVTNLDKYDRLGTPSSQNSLRSKFRKLIKKADVHQRYTGLYKKRIVLPVAEEYNSNAMDNSGSAYNPSAIANPGATDNLNSTVNMTSTINPGYTVNSINESIQQELQHLEQIVDEKYARYTVVSPVHPPEDLINDTFFCDQKIPIYVKDDPVIKDNSCVKDDPVIKDDPNFKDHSAIWRDLIAQLEVQSHWHNP